MGKGVSVNLNSFNSQSGHPCHVFSDCAVFEFIFFPIMLCASVEIELDESV